ncbi:MAG: carboxypeptidase-like regulatory domain-containing protein [Planctomycetota bacterium]|nr:carboxypeptidase-like regulatory domain-containing protein [Planctomycetota bacterium]
MRAALLLLTLAALCGAGLWLFTAGGGVAPPPGASGGAITRSTSAAFASPRAQALPEGVVATRAEAVDIDPGELADRPTVCLRVVDHESERPVAGAVVRRLLSGADLAFTDDQGLAFVPLAEPAQLAVVCEGYLLRLAPARPGSDAQNPQRVRLVRDAWSCVRRFAFEDEDGAPVPTPYVRVRPVAGAALVDCCRASTLDDVAQRAWSEHQMMARKPVSRGQYLHAGAKDDHVYRAADALLSVRFAATGEYRLEVGSTTGGVGAAMVTVAVGPEPPVQVVRVTTGAVIAGVVRGDRGAPLAGATVTVQGGDPLGLAAVTGDDGAFQLGPLLRGARTLLVRHDLHRPAAVEGVAAPSAANQVQLEPLRRTPLRGLVRARPTLDPVAGATVIWQVAGGGAVTARTGADGEFELQAAGDIAARLMIQAPGFVTYAELVEPGGAFANYDLLPAVARARVEAGITATLEGVLLSAGGFPVAGASVRWNATNPPTSRALPGRRVLEGAALELPNVIKTDAAGAFVLETTHFGPGVLMVGGARPLEAEATAVAGQRVPGIELGR